MRLFTCWVLAILIFGGPLAFGGEEKLDWPGLEPIDWGNLDWSLDRPLMIQRYMYRFSTDISPSEQYRQLTHPDGEWASVTAVEFASLPRDQRQLRKKKAAEFRKQSRKMLPSIQRLFNAGTSWEDYRALPSSQDENEWTLFPRSMGFLISATNADPTDPIAWFDLGTMAGLVGDVELQERALLGFFDSVLVQSAEFQNMLMPERIRGELNLAWLYRDLGQMDEGLAHALAAGSLMKLDENSNHMESREARLVAALIHAEQGDSSQSRQLAAPLDDLFFVRRNRVAHNAPKPFLNLARHEMNRPFDQFRIPGRGVPSTPRISVPAQKNAWEKDESDWARNWVLALADLREGEPQKAVQQLHRLDPLEEFPPHLNFRYWNDRGRIYEAAHQHQEARRCYALSAIHRPFFIYYPLEGMRGIARHYDQEAIGYSYFLGCGDFYTSGSLFSFASNCLLTYELEAGEKRKARYANMAEKWLTACIRRNINPSRSRALRGRLYYLQGRPQLAEADLLQAHGELSQMGKEDPEVQLILGLLAFNNQDYAGAEPWLKGFNHLQPQAGIGWRTLGVAQTFTRQLPQAELSFSRAVELEPDNPGGWFNRALVRIKQGEREKALQDLNEAQALMPDNPDIARVMSVVEEGPLPSMDITPTKVNLIVSAQSARRLSQIQADSRMNLVAEISAGGNEAWWQQDSKEAAKQLPDLERAFRFDPSSENRSLLAWTYLAADKALAAQRIMEPLWGQGISTGDLLLLLETDRALGDFARAVALAHGMPQSFEQFPDPAVWSQVAAICLEAGHKDLATKTLQVIAGG